MAHLIQPTAPGPDSMLALIVQTDTELFKKLVYLIIDISYDSIVHLVRIKGDPSTIFKLVKLRVSAKFIDF